MDFKVISSAAHKLLAALEKSNSTDGANLRSSQGPGGTPDPELVRAFESALAQGPEEVMGSGLETGNIQQVANPHESSPGQMPQALSGPDSQGMDTMHLGLENPELKVPHQATITTHQSQDVQFPEQGTLQELQHIIDKISTGQLNAEDLFRMQYLIGMLKVQTESGLQVSQKTAQGFDSLLKQQG